MPRYHYSKSATTPNETHLSSAQEITDDTTMKVQISTSSDAPSGGGTFQSTFIPFLSTNRITTGNKREFIPIPITREENGASSSSTSNTRTVPITYVNETTTTTPLSPLTNPTTGNHSPQSSFISKSPSSLFFATLKSTNQFDLSRSSTTKFKIFSTSIQRRNPDTKFTTFEFCSSSVKFDTPCYDSSHSNSD